MLVMYYAHIGRVMLLYFLQSLYGHLLDDASITSRCKCHQKRGYDEHLKREIYYYKYDIEFLLLI